jgi:hypothetical protein
MQNISSIDLRVGGSVNAAPPAALQIPVAMATLRDELSSLENSLSELRTRLMPVIFSVPTVGLAPAKEPEGAELTQAINGHAAHARYLTSITRELLAGLQL